LPPLKVIFAIEHDLPGIDAFQRVNGADKGGFAGPRRPDDADDLTVFDFQIDTFRT
jgi:hypothetical protein